MAVAEKQYSMDNVNLYEMAFGEGFMSCGGAVYLDLLFADETFSADTRILDVCCGLGGNAFYLEQKYGVQVTGIDRESALIEHAKQTAAQRSSQCEFINSDVITADFEHNHFDYIICRDALLHFSSEQKDQLLQKIRTWLKPGGKFLATDYGITDQPLSPEQQAIHEPKGYHLLMQAEYYDIFERNTFVRVNVANDTERYTQHTQVELDRLIARKQELVANHSESAFDEIVESFERKLQEIADGIKTYWFIQVEKYAIQSQKLKDRVVICTGASSGIGRATAIALAAQGATVALVARSQDKLEKVKVLIEEQGGSCCVTPADVTQRQQMHDLVSTLMARYGRIDVLVNAAGMMCFTFMKNGVFEEWEKMINVNVSGVVNGIGAVVPVFTEQKAGHIINISSDAAKTPFAGLAVYCASKAFVTMLSQSLRGEFRGTGIKITDVQPGDVRTDLVRTNTDTKALEELGISSEFKVGHGWASDMQLLSPFDIADSIVGAVLSKPHVGIHELLIEPRDQ